MRARVKDILGRPYVALIAIVGLFVPRRLRDSWRCECEAELYSRKSILAEWGRLRWRGKLELTRRSSSAFWDALWLQTYHWEDDMIQDVRYALRMMWANLAVTLVAVVTLALTRWIESLLHEVEPTDLSTYVWISTILAAVVFVACFVPARRAAKLDPLVVLREQ